jgi:hypothetical protein
MRKMALARAVSTLCLAAADATGKWSGSLKPDGDEESHSAYLVIQQDGQKLTGSGGPNESEQHPMQNGKIAQDRLTFEVSAGKGTLFFDLKLVGDEMTGSVQLKGESEARTAKVSLKRVGS